MIDPSQAPLQPHLTPTQVTAFTQDGYLVMRQLANAERIARMRALILSDLEQEVGPLEYEADVAYPGAPASLDAEGGHTIRRLQGAYARHSVFAQWAADDRLTAIVAQFLDSPEVWLTPNHHNCIMTKLPRYSTATGWHRDLRYWSFKSPNLVNAWLALGDEQPENGCLKVLPGSHLVEIDDSQLDEAQFLKEDHPDNANLLQTVEHAKLAPGDVLFFHAGIFHAADANMTDERKLSVVTTYFGRDNEPLPGTRSAREPAAIPVRPMTDV